MSTTWRTGAGCAAYQRILTEGTEADVLWYINIDVLLDRRARNEWKREDVEATAELVAARATAELVAARAAAW